jgi:hypothetical protein
LEHKVRIVDDLPVPHCLVLTTDADGFPGGEILKGCVKKRPMEKKQDTCHYCNPPYNHQETTHNLRFAPRESPINIIKLISNGESYLVCGRMPNCDPAPLGLYTGLGQWAVAI